MNQKLKQNKDKLQNTIKHVVVLMLENRSFDNLLGWLYADEPPYDCPPDGQHYEGLTYDLWNSLENIDTDGVSFIEKVPIEKNGQTKWRWGEERSNASVRRVSCDQQQATNFDEHEDFAKPNQTSNGDHGASFSAPNFDRPSFRSP